MLLAIIELRSAAAVPRRINLPSLMPLIIVTCIYEHSFLVGFSAYHLLFEFTLHKGTLSLIELQMVSRNPLMCNNLVLVTFAVERGFLSVC